MKIVRRSRKIRPTALKGAAAIRCFGSVLSVIRNPSSRNRFGVTGRSSRYLAKALFRAIPSY